MQLDVFADHLAFLSTENRISMTDYYFSRCDSHATYYNLLRLILREHVCSRVYFL